MKHPKTLSAAFVRSVAHNGRYGDGHGGFGLSLLVKPMANGRLSKTWSQRLRINGRPVNVGLGSYPVTTLAHARTEALANRRAVEEGRDPRGGGVPTFEAATETVIALHAASWKLGSKTEAQWRSTFAAHVFPAIGRKPIDEVNAADVLLFLAPLAAVTPETARKLRARLGLVFKWAMSQSYRIDNPADARISAALPRNGGRTVHHRALPHEQVGDAIGKVRASGAYKTTVLAFEFLVLTATRSAEARLATWGEVDRENRVWEVPWSRTKNGRAHRVPLSSRALEVLDEAQQYADASELLFPSVTGKPLSDSTISKLCRENEVGMVPHGARASFRSWAADTGCPAEVAEECLGHVNPNKVESAYQRSDMYQRRAALMQAWATYVAEGPCHG